MKSIKFILWFWMLSGLLLFGCRTQPLLLGGVINYGYGSSAENLSISDLEELAGKVNLFFAGRGWKTGKINIKNDINVVTAILSRSMYDKVNFEIDVRLHRTGWDIEVNFTRTEHSKGSVSQREVDKYCKNIIKDVDFILKREVESKWQRSRRDMRTNGLATE